MYAGFELNSDSLQPVSAQGQTFGSDIAFLFTNGPDRRNILALTSESEKKCVGNLNKASRTQRLKENTSNKEVHLLHLQGHRSFDDFLVAFVMKKCSFLLFYEPGRIIF